jgi:hypothetical protein
MNFFTYVIYKCLKIARVFVSGRSFKESLMIMCKTGANMHKVPYR